MKKQPDPIFIFSTPRSGSTLAQRILAAHPEVSTVSEPWILLPFFYSMRKEGIYAEYGQHAVADALEDFCRELPGGRNDYIDEMRTFILRLYAKASEPGSRYFLDKTPRYHIISDKIVDMFPQGKFIFLWRNPLSVVASIMETWNAGKWNLYAWKLDVFDGLAKIIDTYEASADKALSVRYEDMINGPEAEWKRVFDYLELQFDPAVIEKFTETKLKGRMGDPDMDRFKSISKKPIEKWKSTLNTPIRKAWARKYLKWIGSERLKVMGYSLDDLMDQLQSNPSTFKNTGSDAIRMIYGAFYCAFDPRPLKYKIKLLTDWRSVHANS